MIISILSTKFLKWEESDHQRYPPSPSVSQNQRVSGNYASNLWGSITCRQNLDVEELRSLCSRSFSRIGTEFRSLGCHGLDDDRANDNVSATSDVTVVVWKNVDASPEGIATDLTTRAVDTRDFVEQNIFLYCEGRSFS